MFQSKSYSIHQLCWYYLCRTNITYHVIIDILLHLKSSCCFPYKAQSNVTKECRTSRKPNITYNIKPKKTRDDLPKCSVYSRLLFLKIFTFEASKRFHLSWHRAFIQTNTKSKWIFSICNGHSSLSLSIRIKWPSRALWI